MQRVQTRFNLLYSKKISEIKPQSSKEICELFESLKWSQEFERKQNGTYDGKACLLGNVHSAI